jgi:hypothetical protein
VFGLPVDGPSTGRAPSGDIVTTINRRIATWTGGHDGTKGTSLDLAQVTAIATAAQTRTDVTVWKAFGSGVVRDSKPYLKIIHRTATAPGAGGGRAKKATYHLELSPTVYAALRVQELT